MQLKTFILIFLVIFFPFRKAIAQKPKIKVFILSGQSNMVGTTQPLTSELPEDLKNIIPDVIIKVSSVGTGNWEYLRSGLGATSSNFGPEITFGRDMLEFYNSPKIALIKYALGWTSLDYDWRPPSSGGVIGGFFTGLINEVNTVINFLSSAYEVELVGMCWMQGEKDAYESDMANAYEKNLSNFINDIRTSLQSPDLPFIIGMIENTHVWTYRASVRQAEVTVFNKISNVGIFDTSGLPSDGYHFNTQGQIQLGHLFASSMISKINPQQVFENDMILTPNRVSDVFFINSNNIESCKYEIINYSGLSMKEGFINFGTNTIGTLILKSGVYMIRIQSDKKIIIRKFTKI